MLRDTEDSVPREDELRDAEDSVLREEELPEDELLEEEEPDRVFCVVVVFLPSVERRAWEYPFTGAATRASARSDAVAMFSMFFISFGF